MLVFSPVESIRWKEEKVSTFILIPWTRYSWLRAIGYYGDNPAPPDKAHRAGSLLFLPLWHSLVLLSVLLAPSKKDRTFSKTTKCECGNEKTYRAKRCRECHDSKREKASPEQAQWIRDSKKFFVKHP
jgi:hypothetical protein